MIAKKLICIGGIPGVGKSTIGEMLHAHFENENIALICPDETRIEVLGKPKDYAVKKEDMSLSITQKTIALMVDKTKTLLNEKTVIVPSAFVYQNMRTTFETIANDMSIPFHGFWLDAPYQTIKSRAEERIKKDKTISAVIPDETFVPEGKITWHIINADRPAQDILSSVVDVLKSKTI